MSPRTLSAVRALAVFALLTLGLHSAAHAQANCTNLCTQQVVCSPGQTTSISGTVYAPNGTDPLPNVLVYIPNAPVLPFPNNVECNPNGEPASGSPLVSTTTAVNGTFTLTNVPVGSNIPLVIQAGKWRRQFVIPSVSSCVNTPASTATGTGIDSTFVPIGHNIHLPQNQGEGDIPKIAIATGKVDAVECVLSKMGVATSEFTNPGGSGRINLYLGLDGAGAQIAGGGTPNEVQLENNLSTLEQYDLVMLPCQGLAYSPSAGPLANMAQYANVGGRIYATHYSYDFLTYPSTTDPAGPADPATSPFQGVANWDVDQTTSIPTDTATINTSFPDGSLLANWLQVVGASTTLGQIPVNTIRQDQDGINPSTSQEYLSINNPSEVIQFTFSTPVGVPPANQCGRVLYNEYHVENGSFGGTMFPSECTAGAITAQERFLEYSLFDLGTFSSPPATPTVGVSIAASPNPATQGDSADTATISVTNTSTTATNTTLSFALTMPSGLSATTLAGQGTGTGWNCNVTTFSCTRGTGLDAGASDPIQVAYSVSNSATSPQTISATVSNGNLAAPVTGTLVLPVLQLPTIAWGPLAPITYGTPLGSAQLNATASYGGNSVNGTFIYNPPAGTYLTPAPGPQQLNVSFTPDASGTYAATTQIVGLQVNPATPTVTPPSASPITYGTGSVLFSNTITYTGPVAPTGNLFISIDGGPLVPGTCQPAGGSTLNCTTQFFSPAFTLLAAGNHSVVASIVADTNYTASTSSPGTLIVNPAPLTVTAGSYSGTYDGTTHALSACLVSSNPDNLTCTNNPAGPVGPDVTSGAVVVTPVLSGSTSNYNVTSNNGSYSIGPLTVTVTAGGYSGNYDGNTHATLACVSTYAGVTCANSPASVGPSVGNGIVTPVASIAAGNASDYTIASQNSAWSIIPAPSNLSISCPASVAYNGAAQTPCTANVTGAGDLSQGVNVGYFANTNVGTATATATFVNSNYLTSTKMVNFAITPASLTVTAGSYSGTYDGNAHALSACVVSPNPDHLTCTNSPAGPVGPDVTTGAVVVGPLLSGSASNYSVTPNNGSYAIGPLAVTVTAGSYSGVYNGSAHAPSACTSSYTGVACVNSPASVGPGVGSGTVNPVPSYPTGNAADYTVTKATGTYSITKINPVITWANPAAITYGTPLGNTQLDATANVLGTFFYTAPVVGINPAGTLLPAGTSPLGAGFTPTDTADYNSVSAYVQITVNKATTTTTLAVTTTQTVTGTTATITATVHPQIGGTPTGTVTYYSGSTNLGSAAVGTPFTTGVLPVGANQLTAVYSGDSNFIGSSSSATTVTSIAPTNITLIPALSHVFYPASSVAYTVIVPLQLFKIVSGTITIYDGTTVIGTYSVLPTGVVVGVTPQLSVGTHNLRAVYSGNSQYPPGQSPIETVTVTAL